VHVDDGADEPDDEFTIERHDQAVAGIVERCSGRVFVYRVIEDIGCSMSERSSIAWAKQSDVDHGGRRLRGAIHEHSIAEPLSVFPHFA
jgi:hypothetical protein